MKEFKKTLSIDIETYSSVSLPDCGVYPYVEAPDFEILLFGFCFDDEPVKVLDLTKKSLPDDIVQAIKDENILKTAYNANFERVCLSKYIGEHLSPKSWECTMVKALMAGLPGPLGKAAIALGFEEDKQKDRAGKALIRYFSLPCKPTKANGRRTRNLPEHAPDKWDTFISYCGQDVVVEREIRKALSSYKQPEVEHEYWCIDQDINDRGIGLDIELIEAAILVDENLKERAFNEISRITGVNNPNSRAQIKDWVEKSLHIELEKFDKEAISDLVKTLPDGDVKKVLKLRQITTKTSVKKYNKMLDYKCEDLRARGTMQFYGANRTGRFAGRGVQLQNLSKNIVPDLHEARDVVKSKDLDYVELMFGNVSDILSQLVRTAFIPSHGNRFIVSDFSAIEARVIAWVAGEQWRLDVFKDGGDIYCDSASQMFGVPVVKHGINGELRQKGKIAELACGYGGGVGALKNFGADKMGLSEEEMQDIVKKWRAASPNIVKLWWDIDAAATRTIRTGKVSTLQYGIKFGRKCGNLLLRLPSGRKLIYRNARIEENRRFGKPGIVYDGIQQQTHNWGRIDTYGPKIVENCLSADVNVLTSNGVKKIVDVDIKDLLWDGDRWVKHNGVVRKGFRETIAVDGVRMTPDHKILSKGGWINAEEAKRYNRAKVLLPDSRITGTEQVRQTNRFVVVGSRRYEEVYDILNAGDKHCFTVISDKGAMIVHNCVQAIARDCLCISMKRLTDEGFKIVSHVHDEVILDVPRGFSSHEEVSEIMGKPIPWAPGLLLNADGYECDFYMKD